MKISKIFGILALVFCLAISFSSCKKEKAQQDKKFSSEYSEESSSNDIDSLNQYSNPFDEDSTYERTDPCSGPGGNLISMTGNQIFQPGKYVISLTMSQTSWWTYGFSSLLHQYSASPNVNGDVYWRVVKRRQNLGFGNDDYEVYRDCTPLTQGQPETFHCTTADINTGTQPWSHIQLEIVVVNGSASVAWSSYNKSPTSK